MQHLTRAVGSAAKVIRRAGQEGDYDVEFFMQVHAPEAQALAFQGLLARDPDVAKYQFLNHADAYEEFKKLFANQPTLIKNETPAGLPESFRVLVRDGASRAAVVRRYEHQPGVDQVNYSANPFADPRLVTVEPACPKNP
jgi:cell division transport system permease protein